MEMFCCIDAYGNIFDTPLLKYNGLICSPNFETEKDLLSFLDEYQINNIINLTKNYIDNNTLKNLGTYGYDTFYIDFVLTEEEKFYIKLQGYNYEL